MSESGDDGEVIYKKGELEDSDIDEIWDDTALIEAYDKAVSLAYDAAHESLKADGDMNGDDLRASASHHSKKASGEKFSNSKSQKTKKRTKRRKNKSDSSKKWSVGDVCYAKYTDDDLYYEATIISLDLSANTCVVRFSGYENEEEKEISALHLLSDWNQNQSEVSDSGEESRSNVDANSSVDVDQDDFQFAVPKMLSGSSKNEVSGSTSVPFIPPPMPPGFFQSSVETPSEKEALASMLMSWYMSGYHTGYYQAMNDAKKKRRNVHH